MKLQIGGFLDNSLVNGDGMRSVLFVSGCMHNCESCQNQLMQSFDYGDSVLVGDILKKIAKNRPIIKGVTFSGGEPFESALALSKLSEGIRNQGLNIWCYSGYTYDEIINSEDKDKLGLLKFIDVLIDGKFHEELRTDASKYTGSSNQRIIDVQKSISENKIILWNK
ncbi:anaerobic ribonucleoside-triphosphate reductase activating protein [Clostridium tagluense]|uniref:anaerobic ribonucleoside-triphosphate reductase activating protein n=1 Tax=Clostridium tagluense TaxID=360422 RepID=UPI001C0D9A81|nr:anaerobic ribonucleoside-triphosphate reductase activating protein [Clostridium tagluense]MBU3129705.1 anaerobic ribonucleoside-triphosphate reductase activating protein [Clostridium tagluense]MCB2312852.1 anaerobic ribonucleoside-triphosphate reductase activating protein [Clostridium tagluense]MCB2317618.1 anaerobic ribonucleoside-triphosphate reductase activating protein [Clostridium tagluense]MCB2322425.1 anaerobic ribonucleoside-triphosphate reductase activating protein [Clostridium tagl